MTPEKREVYKQKKKLHRQKRRMQKQLEHIQKAEIHRPSRRIKKQRERMQKRRERMQRNVGGRGRTFLRRAIFAALAVMVAVLLATGAINAVVVGTTAGDIYEAGQITAAGGYETAVVFGAKVHEGGALSHMLKDRMDTAIALYRAGAVRKLLLSGDGDGEWSEVKYMRLYAIEQGVAEADILEDGEGYSTIETVERTKEKFGITKCVLVTQKYHLYRAIYAAESMDMDVCGASADVRTYYGQIQRDIREVLARVKDFALCIGK